MNKYIQVFKISFQQEFAYRVNFIMWRFRNLTQIFLVYFLWDSVFNNSQRDLFGYDRAKILTYVFGLLIVKAFVLSAKAVDISGEISRGDLSNYLLRPLNYFKYWLTRDLSSKFLNILFAVFETGVLFIILKPQFYLQTNFLYILAFLVAILMALFLYFALILITSSVPFWVPEAGWGAHFVVSVILIEFLSGALFPLDILPQSFQNVLNLTPFPYLIFFPLQVYLGKIEGTLLIKGILTSFVWVLILWYMMNFIWKKGLKVYQAYGR